MQAFKFIYIAFFAMLSSSALEENAEQKKIAGTVKSKTETNENLCDYFPLKQKMIYTYTQSGGLLGDETVREEYSYIGDKTVNGKIYRGYEIN